MAMKLLSCKINRVIESLLLFLSTLLLASLSLLGKQPAFGLEPVPLALDVFGCVVHIHLLLNLGLFSSFLISVFLLLFSVNLGQGFQLQLDFSVFLGSLFPSVRNAFVFIFEFLYILLLDLLPLLSLLLNDVLLLRNEILDLLADQFFDLHLAPQVSYFLSELGLFHAVQTLHLGQSTFDLALLVLDLELALGFGFVNLVL